MKLSKEQREKADFEEIKSYCAQGAALDKLLVRVSDKVSLCVYEIKSAKTTDNPVVFFVPGWITRPFSWKDVLKEITKDFNVIYIETREKRGGITKGEKDYSISAMSQDIINLINKFKPEEKEYLLLGSSLGATVILHSANSLPVKPVALVLVAPNSEFIVPWFWKVIISLFYPPFYFLIKPAVKWYLKNFRMSVDKDLGQYKKYSAALDAADPWKLKRAVVSLWKYKVWDKISDIDIPCLFIGGSHDKLHTPENLIKMQNIIPESVYIDMKTNSETHSSEMVNHVRKFLKDIIEKEVK